MKDNMEDYKHHCPLYGRYATKEPEIINECIWFTYNKSAKNVFTTCQECQRSKGIWGVSAEPDGVYRLGSDVRAEVPPLPHDHEIVLNYWLAMLTLQQAPQETAA